MASSHASATTTGRSSGWRRLLHRGRAALLLGWFAMWFGTMGYAACAIPAGPPDGSGAVAAVGAIDYAPGALGVPSHGDDPRCQSSPEAGAAPLPALASCVHGQAAANVSLPVATQPLVVRAADRLVRVQVVDVSLSAPALYLRTQRLLI